MTAIIANQRQVNPQIDLGRLLIMFPSQVLVLVRKLAHRAGRTVLQCAVSGIAAVVTALRAFDIGRLAKITPLPSELHLIP